MEAPIVVTIGLASAASTSHPCTFGKSGLRMLRSVQRCFQREGMKWRKDTKPLKVRANAVAGEFMNVNEIRLKLIGKIHPWESTKLSLVMGATI